MPASLRLLVPLVLLLAACKQERAAEPPAAAPAANAAAAEKLDWRRDYHSYAEPASFVTENLSLDLQADFAQRTLAGTALLKLRRVDAEATELVLDTRDLNIEQVEAAVGDGEFAPATFKLDARDDILGSALRIAMPAGADRVRVHYRTSPEASGLQWLEPAQTAERKQPFLFSQSQSIHARSWIPLQDTPQVRITYDARIRTPQTLTAVMGAEREEAESKPGDYFFKMPQPIPPYLLALAIGELKFKPIGPRTGVWAEPSVVDAAAREFADTEAMLTKAEALYGPYRWGRYDLLILPPSFPYGGMENPRLTFASPSVLAGDKSLVSLVAHELAHSWSGNLVTNATWRDFWLNEGFTTYLTGRIMEAVYGAPRAQMEQVLDAQALEESLKEIDIRDAVLAVDMRGRNPDDIVAEIAYNKGALFLQNLEAAFGRQRFDAFLKGWFDSHAFKTATSDDFIAYLDEHLLTPPNSKFTPAKAADWIYGTALPPDTVLPKSDAFDRVDVLRSRFLADEITADKIDASKWSVNEWCHFIDNLPKGITNAQLAALDARFKLSDTGNRLLALSWFQVAIAHDYQPAYPALEKHLKSTGRMLLIKKLYKQLTETESGLAFARRVYAEARPGYHPIAQSEIDKIVLQAPEPKKPEA